MDPLSDQDMKVTNPLGQQHKGFQALAKQTGLWCWFLGCVRRFQAVAMWLPGR